MNSAGNSLGCEDTSEHRPIEFALTCSVCGRVLDAMGKWVRVSPGLLTSIGLRPSHGLCPDCARERYPEVDWGAE